MSFNGNLIYKIYPSKDIDLNHNHIINLDCEKDINFNEKLIKVLEEGLEKLAFKFNMLKYARDEFNPYTGIGDCFRIIANDLREIKNDLKN